MLTNKFLVYLTIFFSVVLISCAPSIKVTGTWKSQEQLQTKKFNKIFILAITGNGELRNKLETEMASAAKKEGFEYITSSQAFPPTAGTTVVKKEELLNKARELGCDGIVTFAVLDQKEESRYVPGNLTYNPIGYGFYDVFNSYYNYWSPVVYSSGYMAQDKYYYLESNFYNTQNEKLLWSVQSEVVNPTNITKFSKKYTAALVAQLKKDAILK